MEADIIVDLRYGDTAKGKVKHFLSRKRAYTHALCYNGGANVGHTIFHKGRKFVTHQIQTSIFWGIRSVIGPGYVVDPERFLAEVRELERGGVQTKGEIFIARNAHIITALHKREDNKDERIGTTKWGNGLAYRDKHARIGIRAEDIPRLRPYLVDSYEEFYGEKNIRILAEGAQWFGLDIDWGDYPYVTLGHYTAARALLNGVTHIVFNKIDVLRTVGRWEAIVARKRTWFKSEPEMRAFLVQRLAKLSIRHSRICFSEDKGRI